jgi:Formyltetrahydrofolate synthetase
MTDIEIASNTKLIPIEEIASKIGIKKDELEFYGKYKAKILKKGSKENGKLILVTSINPTPYGEGKTTMSIGIHDALCKLGKKSIVALREPSLGPVFGTKGGATGGGYAQVIPMDDINLHFTGDIHAMTTANNLLCAAIDNHLFQGNILQIKPESITFSRAMDMNDRSLRNITIGIGKTNFERKDSFQITVASEVMAILCLSKDLNDLKRRLGNILIGFNYEDNPIYAKDLKIEGSLTLILKDAIKPNLVQTLEGNPAIIHGGPFANIAHGCNSLIATKLALSLGDYVVTEAGFGSDLGAEKFLDIKCNIGNLKPDVIVVNATIRSLKYNGLCPKEDLTAENIDYLKKGICNLEVHINNMKQYSNHVIVCLNQFHTDTDEEINFVKDFVNNLNCPFEVSLAHAKGGEGAISLAEQIVNFCNEESTFTPLYDLEYSISRKIKTIATKIYHADEVVYNDEALESIKRIESLGQDNLPICIAKTQYSISDDAKKLGYPTEFSVTVRDVKLCSGAGFIVVYMGSIMTMPGLSKTPAYENMDIDDNYRITGLF